MHAYISFGLVGLGWVGLGARVHVCMRASERACERVCVCADGGVCAGGVCVCMEASLGVIGRVDGQARGRGGSVGGCVCVCTRVQACAHARA